MPAVNNITYIAAYSLKKDISVYRINERAKIQE